MELSKANVKRGECWLTLRSSSKDFCVIHILDTNGKEIDWEKSGSNLNISVGKVKAETR